MEPTVEICDLSKRYRGGNLALDGIDLNIYRGIFGLLGPNGAGKTTLMRILATLLSATRGTARILGHDVHRRRDAVRRAIGYLPQSFSSYPRIRVGELLHAVAGIRGFSGRTRHGRVTEVLEAVSLLEFRRRKVHTLSGGMMRRLGIAQALIANPRVLIVDEPTVGLDPEERIRFRSLLQELAVETTVILSTHIIGDISGSCRDLAVLIEGRLAFRGTPEAFASQAEGRTWELDIAEMELDQLTAEGLTPVSHVQENGRLRVRAVGPRPARPARAVRADLEDAYVDLLHGANR